MAGALHSVLPFANRRKCQPSVMKLTKDWIWAIEEEMFPQASEVRIIQQMYVSFTEIQGGKQSWGRRAKTDYRDIYRISSS